MSFTFRNLFSEEEGGAGSPGGDSAFPEDSSRGVSSSPGTGRGAESSAEAMRDSMDIQVFGVKELLAFIPPAIAASDGIPLDEELEIPMPAYGSLDVKLSELYQACPELFAVEITPLNDSTITLPSKSGLSSEAQSEPEESMAQVQLKGAAFGAQAPAQDVALKAEQDAVVSEDDGGGEDNPFWSPEPLGNDSAPEKPIDEGFGAYVGAEPGGFENGGLSSPENAPDTEKVSREESAADKNPEKPFQGDGFAAGSGFSNPFQEKAVEDESIPAPAEKESENEEADSATQGKWGSMFQGAFDSAEAMREKDNGVTTAGFGNGGIAGQEKDSEIGGGQGKFEAVNAGFAEAASALPQNDESEAPSAAEADELLAASQEIAAGFTGASQGAPEVKDDVAYSGFGGWEASSSEKDSDKKSKDDLELVGEASMKQSEPRAKLENNADSPVQASGFEAFDSPFPGIDREGKKRAKENDSESPSNRKPDSPRDDSSGAKGGGVSVQVSGHSVKTSSVRESNENLRKESQSASHHDAPDASDELEHDLVMRAIFSSSETFNLSKVARLVAAIPGMKGCAISTPKYLVQASKSEEDRLGDEAQEVVETIKNLAKLSGMPDARTFTLQTDRGIVSLFMEGPCSLMVRHDSTTFEPGVREKLVLVSRHIGTMKD
ncbi:MAG: hypothetical protein AAGA96_19140 [Verrucomicrobiota bacterium]